LFALRDIFGIPPKIHNQHIEEAKDAILDGSSKWAATISVTVVEARGLAAKDKKTGTSDPYVTIKVGGTRKRTKTIPKELNPVWDETFEFESHESSDRLKIRVWDEDYDIASKIAGKLKREPDDFLGQVLIDVTSLSGEVDVFYNLEGRTLKSAVSGALHLRIMINVEGEETQAPFHHQYSCLHENLFHYEYKLFKEVLIPQDLMQPNSWVQFFRDPAQEISDEFAKRYGIEDVFRVMTHVTSLVKVYSDPGVTGFMSDLLARVNEYFRDMSTLAVENGELVAARTAGIRQPKISTKLAAVTMGREWFGKTIDILNNRLMIDLANYRETFPSNETQKLADLKSSVNLVTSIFFFKLKVLELTGLQKSTATLKECVQESVRRTYQILKNEVLSVNNETFSDELQLGNTDGTVAVASTVQSDHLETPTKLFDQLLQLMVSAIDEDKNSYSPCFSQLGNFTLWHISAVELWHLFEEDLRSMLEAAQSKFNDVEGPIVTTTEGMNLLFKVKYVFSQYVAEAPEYKELLPDYPKLFHPLVMLWFDENVDLQRNYVTAALQNDRESGVRAYSLSTVILRLECSVFLCLV
jgi:protein unc-13